MEKTKEKNAVYVKFVIAFGANFGRRPIGFVDLIEQEFTLFNRFCVWPSLFLCGPLLKRVNLSVEV